MTVISGFIDRTEHTRSITVSRQRGEDGSFKPIFAVRGPRTRSLGDIDTIVLHQTGFWQSARGNNVTAYDCTIAHFVVLPNGGVLQVRDLEARPNSVAPTHSVHIEFVGCFNADSFDCDAYRRNLARERVGTGGCLHASMHSRAEVPRVPQIQAGRRLVAALVSHDPMMGQIGCILAHRQLTTMSSGRANCPGPHIWYNIGDWARREWHLGTSCHRAQPIPASWRDARFELPPPCTLLPTEETPARGRLERRPEGVTAYASRRQGTRGLV